MEVNFVSKFWCAYFIDILSYIIFHGSTSGCRDKVFVWNYSLNTIFSSTLYDFLTDQKYKSIMNDIRTHWLIDKKIERVICLATFWILVKSWARPVLSLFVSGRKYFPSRIVLNVTDDVTC